MKTILKWLSLSVAIGTLAGAAASTFLILLDHATRFRDTHPLLIWGLPLIGLTLGWVYSTVGRTSARGVSLILAEIRNPERTTSTAMAPLILMTTLLTHLFGGSAGREGTAVQMGASLADQLTRWIRLTATERRILLMAGAGAGFGAAIGTPLAGTLFGYEVLKFKRPPIQSLGVLFLSSWIAYLTTHLLPVPHLSFGQFVSPSPHWKVLAALAVGGVAFGVSTRLFILALEKSRILFGRIFPSLPGRGFAGGLLLALLFSLEGSYRFTGLGIPWIQAALEERLGWELPLLKALFTILTLATGFKGGEFIPLVFVGTTLGSALSGPLGVPPSLLAPLGFSAVFGAASRTPLACAVMGIELFGLSIAPYALIAGGLASLTVGARSTIYPLPPHERTFPNAPLA